MNKTNIILGVSVLALAGAFMIAGSKGASAYQGNPNVPGPYYSAERHDAIQKALETKDYNAWKNLMQGRGRVTQVINESNFAKFAQMHELLKQGKTAEAEAIRAELGLGLGNGQGLNNGRGIGMRGFGGCRRTTI